MMSSSTRAILILLTALLLGAEWAHGHPVQIQSGIVELNDDRVDVQFVISAGEAEHLGTTVSAIADEVQRSLNLFDEYGVRVTLAGAKRAAAADVDGATLRLSYALKNDCRYLTFQQRLPDDALAHHRQLQLSIVRAGEHESDARTIRLSSAGNAVTIPRRPTAPAFDLDAIDPFGDPLLLLRPGDSVAQLELHLPLPLLETWIPIDRAQRDVFTADDLSSLAPKLRRWFPKQLSITGRADAISIRRARLLRPGDAASDDVAHDERRTDDVGFWCARIAIVAEVHASLEQPAELTCDLFNSAVLSLPVIVLDDAGAVQQRRTLSTYTPTMQINSGRHTRSVTQ